MRDSQNSRSRASSRSYLPITLAVIPWLRLSWTNTSTAWVIVCPDSSAVLVGGAPLSWFSSSRLTPSACDHDRVPAPLRNCLPSWLHRRCFRHLQDLANSSPAYLQPGLW